jgi:anti-sigma factor RsiW
MSCSELFEIEDLVLGTVEPARARELRAHLVACTPCRVEEAMLREERALFAQREVCCEEPPAALAAALRAQLTQEVADATTVSTRLSVTASRLGPARRGATRLVRRGGSALASVVRRGHATVACAAALFAFVAFSKLGGAPIVPADEASAGAGSSEERGPRASLLTAAPPSADEPLACTETAQPLAFSSLAPSHAGATTQFYSTFSAAAREELACENGKPSCESCDDVTCPPRRQ